MTYAQRQLIASGPETPAMSVDLSKLQDRCHKPAVSYLGSKAAQAKWIADYVAVEIDPGSRVADLFSGTAAVSTALKLKGFSVVANDHLQWAAHAAKATLFNDLPPTLCALEIDVKSTHVDKYDAALQHLNNLRPVHGFFSREYSPWGPHDRRYFTSQNAGMITAIRQQIAQWAPIISPHETSQLIVDLLVAVSAISNTAGTYGSYLKNWKRAALANLHLRRSTFGPSAPNAAHSVHSEDANALAPKLRVDAIYADPPFTKRQYAAYYHILESIAANDDPNVTGATGLRPWQHLSSPYCFRKYAASALKDLVAHSRWRHFFLSYSADGQIPHDAIMQLLEQFGRVKVFEFATKRYKSNVANGDPAHVMERFYHVNNHQSFTE